MSARCNRVAGRLTNCSFPPTGEHYQGGDQYHAQPASNDVRDVPDAAACAGRQNAAFWVYAYGCGGSVGGCTGEEGRVVLGDLRG